MVFAAGLDGLGPVDLLQDHDPGQMVGEGHSSHGQLEIGLVLDLLADAEGGADEEAGAALSGILHVSELVRKFLGGQDLALGSENAEPAVLRNFGEDHLRLLVKTRLDFGRGGVLREPMLGQLDELERAVALQPLLVFGGGREVELLLELAHDDQCDVKHYRRKPSKIFSSASS